MSYGYMSGLGNETQGDAEEVTADLVQWGREIVESVQAEIAQEPPEPVIAEPIYVGGEAPATNGNGAPAEPADSQQHLMRVSGRAEFHWGGIALLGLTGVFFWWVFKRFMPRMDAAVKREQGL